VSWLFGRNVGKRRRQVLRAQAGVTLIEVLVTLVVVAIGLLGIAGMQVASIKLGFVAESRSNGVLFVNNMFDKMRANSANIANYAIAFGATAPTGTSQAEKDVAAAKSEIAAALPDGDIDIAVTQGVVGSCDAPTVAKCWDVKIQLRWNESTVKGGNSGSAQKFMEVSTRI
jgi:type IV pilus assembly protein PilV